MSTPALSPPQHKRDHLYLKKKKLAGSSKARFVTSTRLLLPSAPVWGRRRRFLSFALAVGLLGFRVCSALSAHHSGAATVCGGPRFHLSRFGAIAHGNSTLVDSGARRRRLRPSPPRAYCMVHPLCVASAASSYQPKTIAAASRGGGVSEQRATEHLLRHGSGGFNGVASERKMATGLEASRCGVSNGLRVLLAGWCRSALSGAFGCSCFESTAWCQPLCVASAASSYPHTTTAVEELGSGVVARQAATGFVIHLGFFGGLGFVWVLRLAGVAAVLSGAFGRSSFLSTAWYKPLCAASAASSYKHTTMAAEDLDGGVVARQAALALAG